MQKKILVVDDDAELVELVSFNLKKAGYALGTAFNGVDALKKARTIRPDLILLDVLMPFIDGDDLYRGLRQDRATRYTPVIYVTGQDAPDKKASRRRITGRR